MKTFSQLIVCLIVGLAAPAGFVSAFLHPQEMPEPAWITPGRVLRVIDGDTLEVEIRRTIRVRMLDCWAPESTMDSRVPEERREAEKARGQASKQALHELATDREVIVRIPTSRSGDLSQSITLGRVLGEVWLTSDPRESLSEKQVAAKHATKTKPEELK